MLFNRNRVVNTTEDLKREMPPLAPMRNDDTNMTDVNGATSAMDEDGELDDSPTILGIQVTHNGAHTDITVNIPSPAGVTSKRIIVPGQLTANRLAIILAAVARW